MSEKPEVPTALSRLKGRKDIYSILNLDPRIRKFSDAVNAASGRLQQSAGSAGRIEGLRAAAEALCTALRQAKESLSKKELFGCLEMAYGKIEEIIILLDKVGRKPDSGIKVDALLDEAQAIKKIFSPCIIRKRIREWADSIVVAFVLAMIIRTFVVQAFKIPTGSMRTTLLEGDIILVNKFIYGARVPLTDMHLPALRKPMRGDVVVFVFPLDPKKDFIKRLIATEGETVEIKNGTIYINGSPVTDSGFSQRYYYNYGEYGVEGNKIKVPKDCYFVLGDNSASSQDSRYWGFVPKRNVLGKAVLIYWPVPRVRLIK